MPFHKSFGLQMRTGGLSSSTSNGATTRESLTNRLRQRRLLLVSFTRRMVLEQWRRLTKRDAAAAFSRSSTGFVLRRKPIAGFLFALSLTEIRKQARLFVGSAHRSISMIASR